MEKKKPPTPPKDRHLKEGALPNKPKLRLVAEQLYSGCSVYRIEKRGWFGWRTIWPDGMKGILGGVRSFYEADEVFRRMTDNNHNITIIREK